MDGNDQMRIENQDSIDIERQRGSPRAFDKHRIHILLAGLECFSTVFHMIKDRVDWDAKKDRNGWR